MEREHRGSDTSQSYEEEPEGDDLYGDNYLEDYRSQSSVSAPSQGDLDFIDNRSALSGHEGPEDQIDDFVALDAAFREQERRGRKRPRTSDGTGQAAPEEGAVSDTSSDTMGSGSSGDSLPSSSSSGVEEEEGSEHSNESDASSQESNPDFPWTTPCTDLAEWIVDERIQTYIRRAVRKLLLTYTSSLGGGGSLVYQRAIQRMVRENKQSLEINFSHLCSVYDATLGKWVADCPEAMLPLLNDAALSVMRRLFPRYVASYPTVYVRIASLSVKDTIRNLRSVQLRTLVHVEGVIIRRSPVFKQLLEVIFDCTTCGAVIGPLLQRGPREVRPNMCPRCQSKGPFKLNVVHSSYRNHQFMVLQESPSNVPPGRLPRTMELIATGDLVDRAKPGDAVDAVGIFRNGYDPVLHNKQGFPVFTTFIELNNLTTRDTMFRNEWTDEEQERIRSMARHPSIKDKLLRSIASSIHGHQDVKYGLLLALLGGVTKMRGKHRIRGDINVLLLGDPGTGKSQFLKFVERTSHRAVFTTGKGSTAVGLTAAVHRDPVSREYVLEGGAMVMADRGVCLIDEFDKMNDHDRTSIHEAMEQQTISVARAGIVTSLHARCTIMAAANPISGRYDRSATLEDNVNLTKPILSRFDLMFVICDESSYESDYMLAKFVTASHRNNHPEEIRAVRRRRQEIARELQQAIHIYAGHPSEENHERVRILQAALQRCSATAPATIAENEDGQSSTFESNPVYDQDPTTSLPLDPTLLTKYILYARTRCSPKIVHTDMHKLPHLFADLRQESETTVRQFESVIRLAEAHARIYLREYVLEEDFDEAIGLFLRCYLRTQKLGHQRHLFTKFSRYMTSQRALLPLVKTRLQGLIKREVAIHLAERGIEPNEITIPFSALEEAVAHDGVSMAVLYDLLLSPGIENVSVHSHSSGRRVLTYRL